MLEYSLCTFLTVKLKFYLIGLFPDNSNLVNNLFNFKLIAIRKNSEFKCTSLEIYVLLYSWFALCLLATLNLMQYQWLFLVSNDCPERWKGLECLKIFWCLNYLNILCTSNGIVLRYRLNNLISKIRHEDYRPLSFILLFVTLRVPPPLDSETGWTGELW